MRGMFLNFTGDATIDEAVEEYTLLHALEDDWIDYTEVRDRMAELIEQGKGLPRETVLARLTEVHGAPQFKSPAQRRWYFATQKGDEGKVPESKGKRWQEILQQAKDALAAQPDITGPELVGLVDMDPPLSPSEQERVEKLVSPERARRLVRAPEAVPKEERTPETEELVTERWPKREREREEKKEKELVPKPKKRTKRTQLGPSQIPFVSQPGMPYVGAEKAPQKAYFLDKCPEIADGDNWRAFQQAVQLVRSDVEDGDVKATLCAEYPEVDPQEILQAAKGYLRQAKKDPYVDGRVYADSLVRQGMSVAALAAEYSSLQWQEVDPRFIQGFQGGLPFDVLRVIRRKERVLL